MLWLRRSAHLWLLLALSGCGGSNVVAPTVPPVITAVTPTSGFAGTPIAFAATVTGDPTAWQWDFGASATPSTSSEASPQVTFNAVGTYQISVSASNASGTSTPFTTEVRVAIARVPTIVELLPEEITDGRGARVTYSASATDDPSSWEWIFGEGAEPSSSTERMPTVQFKEPGTHEGSVVAINEVGRSQRRTFQFSVEDRIAWTQYSLGAAITFWGNEPRIVVVNGTPVVVSMSESRVVSVARGLTSNPLTASDWITHDLDAERIDWFQNVVALGDEVWVTSYDRLDNPSIWIAPATASSFGDWRELPDPLLEHWFTHPYPALIAGRPALVAAPLGYLQLFIAINSNPASAEDWIASSPGPLIDVGEIRLVDIDGHPLMLSHEYADYGAYRPVFSSVSIPSAEDKGAWSSHALSHVAVLAYLGDFSVAGGRPLASFSYDVRGGAAALLVWATSPSPTSSEDWENFYGPLGLYGTSLSPPAVGIVGGEPLVGVSVEGEVKVARPNMSGAWDFTGFGFTTPRHRPDLEGLPDGTAACVYVDTNGFIQFRQSALPIP